MTQEKAMQTIQNHGLYCVALTDRLIGLTDSAGSVYDMIIWDGRQVLDGAETMSLAEWLGY